jgi:hypothetical protein
VPNVNWNLSWSSHNSQRRYPLAGDATGRDQTGSFTLPDDFLLGLDLPVHAGMDVDPARFFLRSVGAFGGGYAITVGYQATDEGSTPVDVATALVPASGFVRERTYALGGVEPFDDTVGKVVVGSLDSIARQPPGFWTFDFDAGRLEPDAIRPIIRGVSSLSVVDGTQESVLLQGDVELVAGTNCRLDVDLGSDTPRIVVNFIQGAGTVSPCECDGDLDSAVPIASLMGVGPTADGAISIIGSECIGVEAIPNGIRLVDLCSKPCCGCPELERVTDDLVRLTQERLTTQEFVSRLQVVVETMNQIVLGARLGDRGCTGA